MKDKIVGGIISFILGDVLGVPVEFKKRDYLGKHPVKGFLEFGTHNQPKGTWSDDSSLLLCTIESLLNGIDYERTMGIFNKWYSEAYWTATNQVFDIGYTTQEAIYSFRQGATALNCGQKLETSNGNGSLMRILAYSCESCHPFLAMPATFGLKVHSGSDTTGVATMGQ